MDDPELPYSRTVYGESRISLRLNACLALAAGVEPVAEIEEGAVLSSFGQGGRMAGQFKWVHNIAIDLHGNLYTAEVGTGRRAQRFVRVK